MAFAEQSVTSTDGTTIAYRREGAGPPLLLVHGIVSDHSVLAALAQRLASAFTVLSVDRRGRGQSGPLGPVEAGLDAQYGDLVAVAEAVGEPCHVFAHSLGAWVALGAAAQTPLLQSLTLYEPPPLTPVLNTLASHLETMVEGGDADAAVTQLLQGLGANRRMIAQLENAPVWPLMVSLAATVPPELRMLAAAEVDLERVTAPVLLMRGTKTPSMVRDVADALAAGLADARIADLEGCDHFTPTFAPSAVAPRLTAFINAE